MTEAAVIFPHQLFSAHPCLTPHRIVYLVEDPWFFGDQVVQFKCHRQKLVLHRAGCQAYREFLERRGHLVRYLEFTPEMNRGYLPARLREDGIGEIVACDPVDRGLTERWRRQAEAAGLKVRFLETPMFLCSPGEIAEFFRGKEKFHQTGFYIWQRRRQDILMEGGKPAGGRWTFDPLNRKRLPRGLPVPDLPDPDNEPYASLAVKYVTQKFPDHPGDASPFRYPVTHAAARKWLEAFLAERLSHFGDYQDAISAREPYIFHALLSPLLNLGLLTPKEVLDATLDFAREHPVPMNSLEGFVRQILGWREYVRAVYLLAGETQRAGNFWGHTREVPHAFYAGSTGIPPVDTVISRLSATAYAHHIERLMVLGNFLLLAEIHPRAVYRWFMEMFIDAYDWVMVPNVFGMSQFADGGLIMTKPYVSSSRYLLKMSDYPAGPWCAVWDGLFWRFIRKHRDYFQKNPRLTPMVRVLDRLPPERLRELLQTAEGFLAGLT
uniref:Cryptochrome/photolyase family protein n=1 Tax=Desulfobacca acetoxidans TaxID=60893 RepID=A0A7V4G7F6_9BACT